MVKEVQLNHENHNCDQQTFEHYPENVRITGDALSKAEQMVQVGGNKKKIKMLLQEQTGKPVLLKSIHNIQNSNQQHNQGTPGDQLKMLYDVLSQITDSYSCFVTDEDDELVGKLICQNHISFT